MDMPSMVHCKTVLFAAIASAVQSSLSGYYWAVAVLLMQDEHALKYLHGVHPTSGKQMKYNTVWVFHSAILHYYA